MLKTCAPATRNAVMAPSFREPELSRRDWICNVCIIQIFENGKNSIVNTSYAFDSLVDDDLLMTIWRILMQNSSNRFAGLFSHSAPLHGMRGVSSSQEK